MTNVSGRCGVQAQSGHHSYGMPCCLLLVSLLFSAWLGLKPEIAKPSVIFFSPFTTSAEAVARARAVGAKIVAYGAYPNSLVVQSEQADFFRRLHEAGVWLIANANGRAGCGAKILSQ